MGQEGLLQEEETHFGLRHTKREVVEDRRLLTARVVLEMGPKC